MRGKTAAHPLSIRFIGANPAVSGEGLELTEARSSFLIEGRLITEVLNYRKVRYRNVWPSIDVVYYGSGRNLEYDFVLRPGADLRKVRLGIGGAESLRANAGGDLVLKTEMGDFVQHTPNIYQEIDGERVRVPGHYRIGADRQVSFKIARYDRDKTLTIDPTLTWQNSSLDPSVLNAKAVAADNFGNVYVA